MALMTCIIFLSLILETAYNGGFFVYQPSCGIMKIYGYTDSEETLLSLEEVTFHVTPTELEQLIFFLNHSLADMKLHGKIFGHAHFSDIKANHAKPDVIIVKNS